MLQATANDRADRLATEAKRLHDELSLEQSNYRNAESLRKQLEIEIREISVRLEEAEAFAAREGKRIIAKLQSRVRQLIATSALTCAAGSSIIAYGPLVDP